MALKKIQFLIQFLSVKNVLDIEIHFRNTGIYGKSIFIDKILQKNMQILARKLQHHCQRQWLTTVLSLRNYKHDVSPSKYLLLRELSRGSLKSISVGASESVSYTVLLLSELLYEWIHYCTLNPKQKIRIFILWVYLLNSFSK